MLFDAILTIDNYAHNYCSATHEHFLFLSILQMSFYLAAVAKRFPKFAPVNARIVSREVSMDALREVRRRN